MSAHPVRGRIAAVISVLALLVVGLGAGVAASQATAAPAPAAQAASATASGTVVTIAPCRIADSRDGYTLYQFAPLAIEYLQVAGTCGVPYGAAGAILSVTVVPSPSANYGGGFLTIWPDNTAQPNVSQVSYNWYNVTTEVTVNVQPWGWIEIFNGTSSTYTDVIVDVSAYIN